MILVDSSVWIDYFNGRRNWQTDRLDLLLGKETVITGDIIMMEVLQGFKLDKDFQTAKAAFERLSCYELCNQDLAIESAANFRFLRKKGITVRKTIDTIIATFCIYYQYTLLHNDEDFQPFEDYLELKVLS